MSDFSAAQPLFVSSRIKVERSRKFIRELEEAQEAYRANDPVSVTMNGSDITTAWERVSALTGAIAGDAIHNLRTSLDQLASELARLSGKSDKDVYFPFASSKDELEAAIKGRRFDKAGDDAVALLRQIAPYRGGNDALRALHDLDIQDKHLTILDVDSNRAIGLQIDWEPKLRRGLDPVCSVLIEPDRINFVFSGGHFDKKPAVETLEGLAKLVEGILDSFTTLIELRA